MAYNGEHFQPIGGLTRSGFGPRVWGYHTTDTEGQVNEAGYFGNQRFALRVGDIIIRTTLDGAGAFVSSGLHVLMTKTATSVTAATLGLASSVPGALLSAGGTMTGLLGLSFDDAVTAAGTVQADAFELTSQFNVITSCAAGAGVKVPNVFDKPIAIRNDTANTVKIWPNNGSRLNALSNNVNDTLEPDAAVTLIRKTGGTKWSSF